MGVKWANALFFPFAPLVLDPNPLFWVFALSLFLFFLDPFALLWVSALSLIHFLFSFVFILLFLPFRYFEDDQGH